jgi:hypothetical protein
MDPAGGGGAAGAGGGTALSHLAVLGMLAAARTELVEAQTVGVVPPVLLGVIVPLAALLTGKRDQDAISFLRHLGVSRES